ncbi:hypothetical protein Plo01_41490 [Planobispora longispora]|uniref:Uncharacterized protein n=1 Tax=Planobispora longispora TaxID=28887 RepID=A0A8J3W6H8_9ACTN|nr:hypothetical protein Plo01_41490 [Planobispora longispora]
MVGQNDTLDFLAGERRERAILRHMMLSLVGGLAVGAVGELLSHGQAALHAVYDPYAHLLLAAVVGWTAAGFGWAVLGSALAALGPVISTLGATLFAAGSHDPHLGADGMELNLTLLALTSAGTLVYAAAAGRRSRRGSGGRDNGGRPSRPNR